MLHASYLAASPSLGLHPATLVGEVCFEHTASCMLWEVDCSHSCMLCALARGDGLGQGCRPWLFVHQARAYAWLQAAAAFLSRCVDLQTPLRSPSVLVSLHHVGLVPRLPPVPLAESYRSVCMCVRVCCDGLIDWPVHRGGFMCALLSTAGILPVVYMSTVLGYSVQQLCVGAHCVMVLSFLQDCLHARALLPCTAMAAHTGSISLAAAAAVRHA